MNLRWRTKSLADSSFRGWNSVSLGTDVQLALTGPLGKAGLDPAAMDLLTVGLAVLTIERGLPANPGTHRPVAFDVEIGVTQPERWDQPALEALQTLLQFQGNATWRWTFKRRTRLNAINSEDTQLDPRSLSHVILFSGGLDSTCGVGTQTAAPEHIQLVSHYSKQKAAQKSIASLLNCPAPTQARIVNRSRRRRGRTFLYRSFYFLCLAASVASSYGARRILQFENGVLATAMPPSPTYFMTRHAHPFVHRYAETLFSSVLGGGWSVENPFLGKTKRECVQALLAVRGRRLGEELIRRTETCWYVNSYQFRANHRKENGVPCGACIPCIIRQTATRRSEGSFDLTRVATKQDPILGREFVAYQQFVDEIWRNRNRRLRLLLSMPTYVRDLADGPKPALTREELVGLFVRFAGEFRRAF